VDGEGRKNKSGTIFTIFKSGTIFRKSWKGKAGKIYPAPFSRERLIAQSNRAM
jgi:hypothetical protein